MLIYHFFLFKMQIRSDCNALNIAGYQCKSFISQFRIKSCGMDTPDPTWKFLKFFFFSHTMQWCMTICHKLFSISWGPFENVNLPFFVLKIQIWNPMKNINVNLSFLSLGSNVVEWTPLTQHENILIFFFCMYCPMMHENLP